METAELAAFMRQLAPAVRGYIVSAIAPLLDRINALEARSAVFVEARGIDASIAPLLARIAAVEAREPLRGEKGDPGRNGQDGERGIDGAAGKDGLNGTNGKDGLPGERGAEGLPGKDGAPGRDGRDGTNGRDGKDGQSVDMAAMSALVVVEIQRALSALAPTLKGEKGEQGPPGRDGAKGDAGAPGRDGQDGSPGINGKDGLPGRDGLNGKDGDPGQDGKPGLAFRGVFKMGGAYEQGDMVTWDGSMWHCNEPTNEKPGTTKSWQLCVRKGQDGKDGSSPPRSNTPFGEK